MEKAKGNQYKKVPLAENAGSTSKTAALETVGISLRDASRAESIARIDEGVFNSLLQVSRAVPVAKADMER